MKNVFKIFKRDLKRLSRNAIALVIVIGISVIPALYAWFNIAANWDPYGSTDGIKVAVVNKDGGFSLHALELNGGDEIVTNLKQNTQMGWTFTDENDAKNGVESGKYYAAVIIPEDFSANLTSIVTGELKRPQIEYYVNEKKNAIAPKITDKGISAIQSEVDSSFISVITESIAKILNATTDDMGQAQREIVGKITDSLKDAQDDIESFQASIGAFCDTVDSMDVGSQSKASAQYLQNAGRGRWLKRLRKGCGRRFKSSDTADFRRSGGNHRFNGFHLYLRRRYGEGSVCTFKNRCGFCRLKA